MKPDSEALVRRAKELAATGEYQFVYQIERALQEGFDIDKAFHGKTEVRAELRALIAKHYGEHR